MTTAEPERLVIRRLLPFAPLVAVVSFGLGWLLDGPEAASSATVAVVVVAANAVAAGWSLAWAARISPVATYAIGIGGFVVRIALFLLLMLGLDGRSWFSPVAFAVAFLLATAIALAAEMKVLAGQRLQADLWYFPERTR